VTAEFIFQHLPAVRDRRYSKLNHYRKSNPIGRF